MEVYSEKKRERKFWQKRCNKKGKTKVVDMRRHWSGFTLKSKFTQHNFHYTCNLALHNALRRIQSSFLFLFEWWQKTMHHDKVIDHLMVVLRFSEPRHPQLLNTINWGNLSFHHKPQCICVVFHLASLRVRFSIRALPSSHTSFQWICFHSKTFHLAPGNSKFFPLVSLDWFFAQALLDLSLSLVW